MKKEQNHINEELLLKIIEQRATDDEVLLFESWKNEDLQNAASFDQFQKVYRLKAVDKNSLSRNWNAVLNKMNEQEAVPAYIELPSSVKTFTISKIIKIAAVFVLVVGIASVLKFMVFNAEQQINISGVNLSQNEAYQLPDGSNVYLNRDGQISFSKDFGKKNRELTLEGEAFFEVKRNEELPFKIQSNETTTRVLGTSFNVDSDNTGNVEVSVVSGVVEFGTDEFSRFVQLHAGEQGNFDSSKAEVNKTVIDDQNFLSWKTGVLSFVNSPANVVLTKIQDYYSRVLVFENSGKAMPTLTAKFDNQTFDAVLEELNLLLNTRNVSRNDTIFILQGH